MTIGANWANAPPPNADAEVTKINFPNLPSKTKTDILLYGPQNVKNTGASVAFAVQRFILRTQRFSHKQLADLPN